MEILNMRVNSITDALALIRDTEFTYSVAGLLAKYKKSVDEDNAIMRQNHGALIAEWEDSKPAIDEKRAQVVGSDEHFLLSQWQKANPKPKLKQYAMFSAVAPIDVAAEAKFLFANEGLIGLCFNTVELDAISNDLDDPAVIQRYQNRLEKAFPNMCKVMFADLWEQYEQEKQERKRAELEAKIVAQQEQAQANQVMVAAEAEAAATKGINIRTAINISLANLVSLIEQLEDPAVSNNHSLTPADMPSVARLLSAIYSANSAQVKTMQGVAGTIARGHISGCRPMSVGCITFFYDWLLSIRTDTNIKSKAFSDWFDGVEGMRLQYIICTKIGRAPPVAAINHQNMLDLL